MSVHSIKWLRHSGRESIEATRLREVSEAMGLKQWVTKPTRKDKGGSDYLLDLVLPDTDVRTVVGPKIRDHRYVLTKMMAAVPETIELKREVWNYSKADWERLKDELREYDWTELHTMDADTAANKVTSIIRDLAKKCIGKRTMKEIKSTHPWRTPEIMRLTKEKKYGGRYGA